jgi:hypothetical protein
LHIAVKISGWIGAEAGREMSINGERLQLIADIFT